MTKIQGYSLLQVRARAMLARLDYSSLRGPSADRERCAFAHDVLRQLGLPSSSPLPLSPPLLTSSASPVLQSGHMQIDLSRPSLTLVDSEPLAVSSLDDERDDTWAAVEWKYAATLPELLAQTISYAQLAAAMNTVVRPTLSWQ